MVGTGYLPDAEGRRHIMRISLINVDDGQKKCSTIIRLGPVLIAIFN